jgi:hypothetical protein
MVKIPLIKEHNYLVKLLRLYAEGNAPAAGLHRVQVLHDDSCGIFCGGRCNCDPDIGWRHIEGSRPHKNHTTDGQWKGGAADE